jgi:hypothetical protein
MLLVVVYYEMILSLTDGLVGHTWTAHQWSLTLNILKLIGAALTGIAGVIAIWSETRTPDKQHLTPGGKSLLSLAILGFGITLSSQVVEWVKGKYDAEEAQIRNAETLSEIRRAVTRLESVSLDVHVSMPIRETGFREYLDTLNAGLLRLSDENARAGQEVDGLRVLTRTIDRISVVDIAPNSPAMPSRKRNGMAAEYVNVVPRVAIFKRHIDVTKFSTDSEGDVSPPPDLLLTPNPGIARLTLALDGEGEERVVGIALDRTGMSVPPERWSESGQLLSLEDLANAQAILYLPWITSSDVQRLWEKTPSVSVTFHFNHQRMALVSSKRARGEFQQVLYAYDLPVVDHTNKALSHYR